MKLNVNTFRQIFTFDLRKIYYQGNLFNKVSSLGLYSKSIFIRFLKQFCNKKHKIKRVMHLPVIENNVSNILFVFFCRKNKFVLKLK